MKKFIVLAVAALSMNAFAQKHMVTLDGFHSDNSQDRSLDFGYGKNDADDEVKTQNIALNYAYAFNDQWQAGVVYKNYKQTAGGDVTDSENNKVTMGLKAIYNFSGLTNTNYLAVGYQVAKNEENDNAGGDEINTKTIGLEFGHRFSLGNLWGMNFNYSPSATVSQTTIENDDTTEDTKTTAVSLNFVKFDVLF